jgi:cytochrome c
MGRWAILAGVVLLCVGCNESTTNKAGTLDELNASVQQMIGVASQAASDAIGAAGEVLNENTTNALTDAAADVMNSVAQAADALGQNLSAQAPVIAEAISNITDAAAKAAGEVAKSVSNATAETAKKITPKASEKSASIDSANGEKVFKKCIVCHGKKAEKSALNNSLILADLDFETVTSALKNYRDDATYGGKMKMSMRPIAKPLSDKDISDVAHYVGTLK